MVRFQIKCYIKIIFFIMIMTKIYKIINYFNAYGFFFIFKYTFRYALLLFYYRPFFKNILIQIFDFKLKIISKDTGISKALYLFRERELEHKFILEHSLSKKHKYNIYDIGSNIGYYMMIFNRLISSDSKIVAIEPVRSNFSLLKDNIKINKVKNSISFNCAISNTVGQKEIYLSESSNLNTFHNYGSIKKKLDGKLENVKLKTIEEIYKITKLEPNFIRMDVEGHEVEILNSLLLLINKNNFNPKILFEIHLSRYNEKHNLSNILKKFYSLGFIASIIGTSSLNGTKYLENAGYKNIKSIYSDGYKRGIFLNIELPILDLMVHKEGGIRTILLEKNEK